MATTLRDPTPAPKSGYGKLPQRSRPKVPPAVPLGLLGGLIERLSGRPEVTYPTSREPALRTRKRANSGGLELEAPRGIEPRFTDLQSVA